MNDIFETLFGSPPKPKRRSRPKFTDKEISALYSLQNGKCNGCGRKFPKDIFEVDHIVPFSRDGGERLNNLQLLCPPCNGKKGAGTQAQLKKRLTEEGTTKGTSSRVKTTRTPSKNAPTITGFRGQRFNSIFSDTIELAWKCSGSGSRITGYQLQCQVSEDGGPLSAWRNTKTQPKGTSTECSFDVPKNVTAKFRVRAKSSGGAGPWKELG